MVGKVPWGCTESPYLNFDYNTWDLINHFWECSLVYCKILKYESKYLELGDSVLHRRSNF